jgi:hypothetical protein
MNYCTSVKNYCFLVDNKQRTTATRNMLQTEHQSCIWSVLSINIGFDLNDVVRRLAFWLKSRPNISPSSVTPTRTNEDMLFKSLTKTNQSISTKSLIILNQQYIHETSYRETYSRSVGLFSYCSSVVQADIILKHCLFRVWGSRGDNYEGCHLVGSCAVQSGRRLPTSDKSTASGFKVDEYGCLLGLPFYLENRGNTFLREVSELLPHCKVSHTPLHSFHYVKLYTA